jgi:hypothetical protein
MRADPRKRRKGDISAALSRILPEKGSRRRTSLKNHIIAGTYRQIVKIVPMPEVPQSVAENDFLKEKGRHFCRPS